MYIYPAGAAFYVSIQLNLTLYRQLNHEADFLQHENSTGDPQMKPYYTYDFKKITYWLFWSQRFFMCSPKPWKAPSKSLKKKTNFPLRVEKKVYV